MRTDKIFTESEYHFRREYRWRRSKTAWKVEWSWIWDIVVAGVITMLISLAIFRPQLDGAWQNFALPLLIGISAVVIMHFVVRPIYRYIFTVPEQEHLDRLQDKAELNAKVRAL